MKTPTAPRACSKLCKLRPGQAVRFVDFRTGQIRLGSRNATLEAMNGRSRRVDFQLLRRVVEA